MKIESKSDFLIAISLLFLVRVHFSGANDLFLAKDGTEVLAIRCLYDMHTATHVCSCDGRTQAMEMPQLSGNIGAIRVEKCQVLRLRPNTFAFVSQLQDLTFVDVEHLIVDELALAFPRFSSTAINFTNVGVTSLPSHAISGNVSDLLFFGCHIGSLQPFSLSNLRSRTAQHVVFRDTVIDQVRPKAFKKFQTSNLEFFNCTFDEDLPSYAFYEMEVTELFEVEQTSFFAIRPAAFHFDRVAKIRFWSNNATSVDGEAFVMRVAHDVSFINNRFTLLSNAAFRNITPDEPQTLAQKMKKPEFTFQSNHLEKFDQQTLVMAPTGFDPKITRIYVDEPQTCESVAKMEFSPFVRKNSDEIYLKLEEGHNRDPQPVKQLNSDFCTARSYVFWGLTGVGILSLLVIIVICSILYYFHAQRQKLIKERMIKPEGKTYRETQIVMQVEQHGLLKTDL